MPNPVTLLDAAMKTLSAAAAKFPKRVAIELSTRIPSKKDGSAFEVEVPKALWSDFGIRSESDAYRVLEKMSEDQVGAILSHVGLKPLTSPSGPKLADVPTFLDYASGMKWVASRIREFPSKREYLVTDEYTKAVYPQLKDLNKAEQQAHGRELAGQLAASGLKVGDKVWRRAHSFTGIGTVYTGVVAMKAGTPIVKLDEAVAVSNGSRIGYSKTLPWNPSWKKK